MFARFLVYSFAVSWALSATACDTKSSSSGSPPPPYSGSLAQTPECELAADCPAGLYCDLGRCYQACNTVDPCTGELVCIPRGRCAESSSAPADPDPAPSVPTQVTALTTRLSLGAADNVAMIQVAAADPNVDIRYRIDSQVPWLRVDEERGTFRGTLGKMLTVDRSAVGPGQYDGTVIVRTTVGDVTIPVHLEQSLTGTYAGVIRYTGPRTLGESFLRFDLYAEGAFARMRVDASRSPLFPAIDPDGSSGRLPATTTVTVTDGTTLKGTITQVFKTSDLGTDALFPRSLGRQFIFQMSVGANGGFSGTFEERWFGLLPSTVVLTGTIDAARQSSATAVTAFTVDPTPSLPQNPAAAAPAISTSCSATAAAATSQTTAACGAAGSTVQLTTCGAKMRSLGATLENTGGLLVGDPAHPERGYASFETACTSDWNLGAAVPSPSATAPQCVQRGNVDCSASLYGALVGRGLQAGYQGVSDLATDVSGIGVFLVNTNLVDAFELPYRQPNSSTLATQVLSELDTSRSYGRSAMAFVFDPFVLESLRAMPLSVASSTEYVALRRAALLVARTRLAGEEKSRLEVRRGLVPKSQLQDGLWHDGVTLVASLAVLSTIEQAQAAPPTPELGTLAEALTATSRHFIEVQEGVQAYGVPEGYVPFIYDPLRPEPTNFEQNLHEANVAIATAVTAETAAQAATRDYEQQLDMLKTQLQDVNLQHQHQLGLLCGFRMDQPTQPDLDHCGATSGTIAEAMAQNEAARLAVRTAVERIAALDARVQIQYDRLRANQKLDASLIKFIDRTGNQINALDVKNQQLQLVRDVISLSSQGGLFNPGPFLAVAATAAIGMKQIEISSRRDALALTQQLAPYMTNMQKEQVDGLATIRDMLVSEAELNLQLAQESQLAVAAAVRVRDLQQEVAALRAELDIATARLTDTTRPLGNNATFRILRDEAVLSAITARDEAQRKAYLAGLAFEFETNVDDPAIESYLLPALRASDVQHFADVCLSQQYGTFRQTYGTRQTYVDEVSLREDILGIRGPLQDPVTGEVLSEAAQLRQLLLAASHRRPDGTVTLQFSTALSAGNGIFSTAVCNDQVRSIQVKLIGDGLGDDQSTVYLEQRGSALQRSCAAYRGGGADVIREYVIPDGQITRAVIQSGVNAYPTAPADTQLFGRAVAASQWVLSIPPGPLEPRNADVDVTHIEDVVFRIEHSAISIQPSGAVYTPSCQ